ncbi:eukaryotic translation initiation factor 3 subunit K-like [Ptychodera flava]|uniref:eukaryotic translation initiation factor 3 subunit K-like n=1 Tax=Ptychodera flava TaxID=63121 RepID=UPI00396A9BA3
MADHLSMRRNVASLLKGIDRYNPENLGTLERYVEMQAKENTYDLEANLAVLKLYQFNPMFFQLNVTTQILLKALTNLPHTDFVLCKCLIDEQHQQEDQITKILYLYDLLETCQFKKFWSEISHSEIIVGVNGFKDSIRKYICHVMGITYQTIDQDLLAELLGDLSHEELKQWMTKYGWAVTQDGKAFIANQEENVKPKNITEKIDFDSVAGILAASAQ